MRIALGKKTRTVLATGGLALALTACHYAGSGTVASASGHGVASFSFDLNCPTGGKTQTGALVYVDNSAHVMLRATVTGTPNSSTCWSNSANEGEFEGTYVPLTGGAGGTFYVDVTPGNSVLNPGKATFYLDLTGGVYDGYTNSGPVLTGTITPVGGPGA